MTRFSKILALCGLCFGLGACALERGTSVMCSGAGPAELVAQSAFDPTQTDVVIDADAFAPSMADAFRQTVEAETRRAPAKRAAKAPVVIDVLALSAGGQYGSFGAGFLRGWAQNPRMPRPSFDLVTGVSAGGMLAPVAFSGGAHDASLDAFRGLDSKGVFRGRSVFALPTASSFFDPGPLEKMLSASLTDALIADVAARHRSGARLLVMAVDLDTTRATVFDLGEIAASSETVAMKRRCMTEVMLASAAIPGVFPPRNIDGTLYVDGGLRDQIFLTRVESARAQVARQTGRPVRIKATIVINGSLRAPDGPVRDSLLGYAERSLFTLSDEVLRDSLFETLAFADANKNWTVQGVIADLDVETQCPVGETVGTFDACVTMALYDSGVAMGKASPVEFKTSAELRALAELY